VSPARREAAVFGVLAAVAVVVWALVPTFPNYDAYYHLVWGRELLDGQKPGFDAYQAPTQHPLYLALGALLAGVFGSSADRALVLVAVLALVALVWAVLRTGRAVFGFWPGVAAALLTASSFALLLFAARAYVDVPFLALVFWAAAVEAAAPRRRPWLVMALLTVAGLLRPEAWLLAGLFWLWMVWPRSAAGRREPRLGLLALAAAAPVLWALTDLWVTGDPLWSLNATSDLAEELGRERGLANVPGAFVSFLADQLRPPVLLAALGGLALALWRRDGRSLHVPLALLGAGTFAFVASGALGLSILPRYLTVPSIALTLFAGYALAGWAALPAGARLRRRWAAGVTVLAMLGAGFVVARASVVDRLVTEVRYIRSTHDDLVGVLALPEVRRARACGPVTLPNYRLVPDVRWILDASQSEVGARSAKRRDTGVALFFADRKTLRRFGFADGTPPSTNAPDPGFERVGRVGHYAAYVSCP
jgi:hypothetical protein